MAVGAIGWLGFVDDAHAVDHQLCLDFDIGDDFWDASPRAADSEDFYENYGRNEATRPYPAQRWLVRITDETTDEVVFGWLPLDGNGCADFQIESSSTTFRVQWVLWAVWDGDADANAPDTGNQVFVYDCAQPTSTQPTDCEFNLLSESNVSAGAGGSTSVNPGAPGDEDVPEETLPLWAVSWAEERFASLGQNPLSGRTSYLCVDDDGAGGGVAFPGVSTGSNRLVGGWPTTVLQGNGWHSKYKIAHEYGHIQTTLAGTGFAATDLDYGYPNLEPGEGGQHLLTSQEWQAAAAVEGLANFYALAAWNDLDLPESCVFCSNSSRYVQPGSATMASTSQVRRPNGPVCVEANVVVCEDGVTNEWDWASALKALWLSTQPNPPDFGVVFNMMREYYLEATVSTLDDLDYHVNGADDDFWTDFDSVMSTHLGTYYGDWTAAAALWSLDR